MKFEYTGRHIEVSPAIKAHVEDHFQKIDHLFDRSENHAHVIIEVERGFHRSEMIVKWRNQGLTATTTDADMYHSLSEPVSKIEQQALKIKNTINARTHRAKKVSEIAAQTGELD